MKDLLRRNKVNACFKNYDRIVAVSESVRQSFIDATGISRNICVKYNTFNIPYILQCSKEKNFHLLKQNGQITLSSVGKLESVKGFDRMRIRILAKLKKDGIFTWNVIGEGIDREKIGKHD
ncbi:MAG: hypothetical protein ACLRUZ_13155 [Faecalimonas sp.]